MLELKGNTVQLIINWQQLFEMSGCGVIITIEVIAGPRYWAVIISDVGLLIFHPLSCEIESRNYLFVPTHGDYHKYLVSLHCHSNCYVYSCGD